MRIGKFTGLLKKEVLRFFKVRYQTLGTPVVAMLLYLLIFGVRLGENIEISGFDSYLLFLIPGLLAMNAIRNSFENASSSVVASKYVSELQDLRVTPLSPTLIIWAKSISSLTRGVIVSLFTLIIAQIFYWLQVGSWIPFVNPISFFFFLTMGSLTYAQLGLSIAMISKSFEQIGAITSFVLVPLIYLGGVFFPVNHFHPIWQKFSYANPLAYTISGIRYGMLGESGMSLPWSYGMTLLFFCITYTLAYRSLLRGKNYTR